MTTLPKFIDLIQPLDGRDTSTLMQFGRVLREAGYIPAGKRGKGAPILGLEHAVNLLLGVYGASSPKDGPMAVSRFRRLVTDGCGGEFACKSGTLKNIAQAETFGEALEELLVGLPRLLVSICEIKTNGEPMEQETLDVWVPRTAKGMGPADIRVSLHAAFAEIEIYQAQCTLWTARFSIDPDHFMNGDYNAVFNADRQVSFSFSVRTLAAFHFALMEGLEEAGPVKIDIGKGVAIAS